MTQLSLNLRASSLAAAGHRTGHHQIRPDLEFFILMNLLILLYNTVVAPKFRGGIYGGMSIAKTLQSLLCIGNIIN